MSERPSSASEPPPMPSRRRALELGLAWEIEHFFSTSNLLAAEPAEETLTLVLSVRVTVETRESVDREEEVSPARLPALVAAASIERAPSGRGMWQCVTSVHDATPRACSACRYGPPLCSACGGSGKIVIERGNDDNQWVKCVGCDGKGLIPCGICDGLGLAQRVTLRTITDETASISRRFFPEHPYPLGWELEEALAHATLEDALRVDLARPTSAALGSYRSSEASTAPRFFGIDTAGALPKARAFVEGVARAPATRRVDVVAHAVPVAHLRYPHHDLALFGGHHLELVGAKR